MALVSTNNIPFQPISIGRVAKYINIPNDNTHVLDYLKSQNPESMFLASVEESEVINIVRNCKNKKYTGYDGIDMTIIKQVIYHIIKPFTHIGNNSFENGVFPSKMKIAKVVPIFKAGHKSSFNNYRPISLLPQFSKIVEKLFNARLDAFIEKHDTLTSSQYGFRSSMSTSLALLELTEEITSALDHKKSTIGVFIDLKKAFDTINHGILLKNQTWQMLYVVFHKDLFLGRNYLYYISMTFVIHLLY